MNKVILMGRTTQDIELRQTANGKSVTTFSIAVKRRFAQEGQTPQTDFINCVAWGSQAEFIAKYFNKGSMISVIGNIQTRSWDGEDGKKRYATEVIVDEVYFTGEKRENANNGNSDAFSQGGFESFEVMTAPDESDLPF